MSALGFRLFSAGLVICCLLFKDCLFSLVLATCVICVCRLRCGFVLVRFAVLVAVLTMGWLQVVWLVLRFGLCWFDCAACRARFVGWLFMCIVY